MSRIEIGRRRVMQGAALAGSAAAAGTGAAIAQNRPVQMISHRYPALEHWAAKMKTAIPGQEVNTQLMPFDKALELLTIALSAKADTVDIAYASDATVQTFAKNGWLRPLDDLWARFKAEFKLDDYAPEVLEKFSYQGKLYILPANLNVMFLFYRKDLFDQAGVKPPATITEFQALAKRFHSPLRAGTVSCLKPVDAGLNEAHWYLNALGDGWFDKDWRPIFNQPKGVAAIEALKETVKFAQRAYTAAANDECSIAFQQDAAAMGLQWATRAASMDDPKQSRVVGKFDWVAAPGGRARLSGDGYGISSFTKHDPEMLFRLIATATNQANSREGAALSVPPRGSILNDPELQAKHRFYPAASAAMKTNLPFPQIPEFYAVGEFITRRVIQAVTGEMPVKAALDAAAKETEDFLRGRGYYKG
jgi:ABC-type glycerol-3-phosphate transport system substrate-binding protein